MIKSRKAIIAVILTLIAVLVVAMCISNREGEEEAQQLIDTEKLWYAKSLEFGFRIVVRGNAFRSGESVFMHILVRPDPFYTDLVFVHSRTEAEGFPDNTVVAWPRAGGGQATVQLLQEYVDKTEAELNGRGLLRPVITLEQFGLTQPLTAEDLVNNWEKVNALIQALDPNERGIIGINASTSVDLEAEGIIIERDEEWNIINIEHLP